MLKIQVISWKYLLCERKYNMRTIEIPQRTHIFKVGHCLKVHNYKARHAHKRLYTVLPKYSKIQVLPGITSCRLVKDNKQAIELNSLLLNNMPKDGYGWN